MDQEMKAIFNKFHLPRTELGTKNTGQGERLKLVCMIHISRLQDKKSRKYKKII